MDRITQSKLLITFCGIDSILSYQIDDNFLTNQNGKYHHHPGCILTTYNQPSDTLARNPPNNFKYNETSNASVLKGAAGP